MHWNRALIKLHLLWNIEYSISCGYISKSSFSSFLGKSKIDINFSLSLDIPNGLNTGERIKYVTVFPFLTITHG